MQRLKPKRLSWRLAPVALSAVALAACNRSASHEQSGAKPSHTAVATSKDACSLLEPKEVEAVLGAPLATAPFLSRDGIPQYDGTACDYEDAGLHNITIDVTWRGGATVFGMYGAFQGLVDQTAVKGIVHVGEGSDVAGEWDEARVAGCCKFVALRGDQMIRVDVGGSKAPLAAAAKLADSALKRLDHTLSLRGLPNVKASIEFETANRPKPRDACALVSRAEAEALIGRLAGDPKSIDERCLYELAGEGGFAPTYVMKVRWTGGFSDFRQHNDIATTFAKAFTASLPLPGDRTEALGASVTGSDLAANSAWELAHVSITGLSAVKKDVLVSIDSESGRTDEAVKLMAKAMSKL